MEPGRPTALLPAHPTVLLQEHLIVLLREHPIALLQEHPTVLRITGSLPRQRARQHRPLIVLLQEAIHHRHVLRHPILPEVEDVVWVEVEVEEPAAAVEAVDDN